MKRLFSSLFLLALSYFTFAQVVASNDTTICRGTSAQLHVSGGTTYTWTPSTNLSSTTSANPTATPTSTTTYVVSSSINTGNIVVNGTFAQGNTGFATQYIYDWPTNSSGGGAYFVGGNAAHWNSNMSSTCGDRNTDADSNMLVVNGSGTANVNIWCETLSVLPGVDYSLSAYFQELHTSNYPILQWTVNGTNVGSQTTATFFVCFWTHATATWNAGINTSATFCLQDPNLQGNGNDLAIDEISITGTGTSRDTVVVTVVNAPTVSLGNDTSICVGQSLSLDAGNAGATYHWNDNSSAQTLAVTNSGNYAVTVSTGVCSASDAIQVDPFTLTVTTASVNTTCGNSNGQASVTPGNGTSPYTFVWSNTGSTDTISGLAGGTYIVTVHDAHSCSAVDSAVVNTSGSGNVSITGQNTQICTTDSAEICAPANYTSYLWSTGATGMCIHPTSAGNYYVTVTDNGNCTAESNHIAVSVFPVPPVSVSVNGDTLRAFNATAYQWYRNGNQIGGATNSMYIASQAGSYIVEVTDSNGCKAVSNPLVVSGIEDYTADVSIDVYPNPTNSAGWQLLVGSGLLGKEIELSDASGRVVYQSHITNLKSQIQPEIAAGIYLLKINAGRQSYFRKLIKL